MLNGKNAIITGAKQGIGRAAVEIFAKNHCNIWACDLAADKVFEEEMASLAEKHHVWIKPVCFDLADKEQVKQEFKGIYGERKPIDILANVAGKIHAALFQMSTLEQVEDIYAVNVFGLMQLTQLTLKVMTRQKSGSVINIASIAGQDANPTNTIYGSSKAAQISFSRILGAEVGAQGIRVNVIAPGPTNTEMIKTVHEKVGDALLQNCAMKRLAEPEEVANVALFLASDLSSFVNGQVIRVDGGAC